MGGRTYVRYCTALLSENRTRLVGGCKRSPGLSPPSKHTCSTPFAAWPPPTRSPVYPIFTGSTWGGGVLRGVKGEVKGWGLSRRKREESWRDAIRNPMSLLNYLQKKCAKSSLFFYFSRITGAKSDRNIHASVSEQLKKNFAKSRWKVSAGKMAFCPSFIPPSLRTSSKVCAMFGGAGRPLVKLGPSLPIITTWLAVCFPLLCSPAHTSWEMTVCLGHPGQCAASLSVLRPLSSVVL